MHTLTRPVFEKKPNCKLTSDTARKQLVNEASSKNQRISTINHMTMCSSQTRKRQTNENRTTPAPTTMMTMVHGKSQPRPKQQPPHQNTRHHRNTIEAEVKSDKSKALFPLLLLPSPSPETYSQARDGNHCGNLSANLVVTQHKDL